MVNQFGYSLIFVRFVQMNKAIKLVFALLVALLFAVLIFSMSGQTPMINDSKEYTVLANNLLNNNAVYSGNLTLEKDFRLYSKRTIGYPLLLIFQNLSPIFVRIAQLLLVVLSFFIGLDVLRKLSTSKTSFIIYSIMYLLNLAFIFHCGIFLSDLFLGSIVTSAGFIFIHKRIPSFQKVQHLSFLWGLALMIKPILLPSILLTPIVFIWFYAKQHKLYFSLYTPVFIWLLFSFINYKNTNQFEYSSISTINLSQYNAKLTIAKAYGYDSAQTFINNSNLDIPTTASEYDTYKKAATNLGMSAITENFLSYLKVHTLGAIKMIIDPGRFEIYTFFKEPTSEVSLTEMLFAQNWVSLKNALAKNPKLLLVFAILLVVSLLKLIGFMAGIKDFKKTAFMLVCILYFVGVAGPVGAARFFLPVSVFYLIIAATGWETILNFFQKGSKSQ